MTCMTKAQREAAEEAVRVEQEKQLRVEYPTRLMKALSQATELQFVLSVVDDSFVVTDPNERCGEVFTMSYDYNVAAEEYLRDLELELELKLKYAEFVEKERRQQVRANALAKLSDEERELLGVK